MPGWRPRKVDCAGVSSASVVAVVVVSPLGHVDGEERVMGGLGVGGASASAIPDRVLAAYLGDNERGGRRGAFEGFSGRKLCASAPSAAMPAGIVTFLGASMRLPFARQGFG